jgi:hypothetical protein
MGLSTRFSRIIIAGGMAAISALGLGACGPDYSLFKVHVSITGKQDELVPISNCSMSVYADSDERIPVLRDYPLDTEYNNGELVAGCAGGLTKSNVGIFSYSTSRKDGSLKFRMNAYSDSAAVIKSGASDMVQVKAYPPEIDVYVTAKTP